MCVLKLCKEIILLIPSMVLGGKLFLYQARSMRPGEGKLTDSRSTGEKFGFTQMWEYSVVRNLQNSQRGGYTYASIPRGKDLYTSLRKMTFWGLVGNSRRFYWAFLS